MELAAEIKTTSANISQQLRLLELGGLVKSEKTSNVDKGKPRVIYSLAGNNAYLILASPNFTEKKMISLSLYHNFMMRSWFLENPEHHPLMNQIYFEIKNHLKKIKIIAAESGVSLTIYVVADKEFKIDTGKVRVKFIDEDSLRKKSAVVLYDPLRIYSEVRESDL